MMFDPRLLYAVTGDLPASYKGMSSISLDVSPYEYEAAKARYTAYRLLEDACIKSVLAFDVQYRAVPPDAEVTMEWMAQWRDEIDAANHTAILALQKALMAVEEAD